MADFNSAIKLSFIDDFSRGAQTAQKQIKGLDAAAGGFHKAGKSMVKAGAGLSVFEAGAALNRGMTKVQSLGLAQERVEELKRGVQEVAIATRTGTNEMAEGLYQVVSAYGDSGDTLKILELNAKAAAAELSSTIVKLGQTDFPQLASSMGRLIPLVVNLGASLATLTGVTGSAAEVGTQLRGTLQALSAPTAAMNALMQEYGVTSAKAMVEQLGLQGSFLAIAQAAEEGGKPLQAYMGSIEGQIAALTLAGVQLDSFAAKMEEIGNTSGATQAGFLAQTEGIITAGSSMDLMRVKLEVMMQRLSDGMAPAITVNLEVVKPFIDKVGTLTSFFGDLVGGISDVVSISKAMKPMLGSLGSGIKKVAGKALKAIPSMISFAVANWAVIAPILAIIVAIGALIAAVVLVVKHWDKIKAFFVNLWEGIKNIFRAAIDWVVGILDNKFAQAALVVVMPFIGIPLAIIKNWDKIKAFFVNLWEGIKNIFKAGIDWIRSKLAAIPLIGGLFDGKKDGLFGGPQGSAAVNTLAGGMTAALPAAEQAGLSVAKTVDQYMPHSDAKKGPLSKLSQSGGALVETLRRGAQKKRLNLSDALGSLGRSSGQAEPDSITINIDNLTVQSDDAEDIFSFVRMLRIAGGAA